MVVNIWIFFVVVLIKICGVVAQNSLTSKLDVTMNGWSSKVFLDKGYVNRVETNLRQQVKKFS